MKVANSLEVDLEIPPPLDQRYLSPRQLLQLMTHLYDTEQVKEPIQAIVYIDAEGEMGIGLANLSQDTHRVRCGSLVTGEFGLTHFLPVIGTDGKQKVHKWDEAIFEVAGEEIWIEGRALRDNPMEYNFGLEGRPFAVKKILSGKQEISFEITVDGEKKEIPVFFCILKVKLNEAFSPKLPGTFE